MEHDNQTTMKHCIAKRVYPNKPGAESSSQKDRIRELVSEKSEYAKKTLSAEPALTQTKDDITLETWPYQFKVEFAKTEVRASLTNICEGVGHYELREMYVSLLDKIMAATT